MKLVVGIYALVSAIPTNHNSARSAARADATPAEVEMVSQNRNSPSGRVVLRDQNTGYDRVTLYAQDGSLIGHVSLAQLRNGTECLAAKSVPEALRQVRRDSRGNLACSRSASRNIAAAPTATVPALLQQPARDSKLTSRPTASTATAVNQGRNTRLAESHTTLKTVTPTINSQRASRPRQEPTAPQVILMQREISIEREIQMEDTRTYCEVGCELFESCCYSLAEGEFTFCIAGCAVVIGLPLIVCLN